MSDFNQSSHDLKIFMDEVTRSTDKALLFEECLLFVFLPDLNTFKKATLHDGVRDLFKWLSDKGKVKRIKSLDIPDSTTLPMCDELVSEAIIDVFEIEKFNWRKLDINLDILVRSSHRKEFTDIPLYSSGNFSVLYHWISPRGLEQLTGLRKVTIEIMELDESHQPKEAQTRHEILVNEYEKELTASLDAMKEEKKKQTPPIYLGLLTKLEVCHKFLGQMKDDPQYRQFDSFFQRLKHEPGVAENSRLIKVAVIDNGADEFRQKIRDVIEKGVSYVKADRRARIESCLGGWLYIARVGKSRKDIFPEDAVQAVKWAIEQKVDVISISWITKSEFPDLKEAIEEASKHALVFCSTADEGSWSNRVYPASYDGTVRVSATDKYGNLMPASDKDAINIPVPGQDIPAFGPSYMGIGISRGTVSGSSVATALAAGIASLALLLLQVFNEAHRAELVQKGFYKNEKIVDVLSRISPTDKHPSSLFPTRVTETVELPERWHFKNFD